MKKTLLCAAALGIWQLYNAQEALSSQGEVFETLQVQLQFTVGEAVIQTYGNSNNDLTQGFHQTVWEFVSLKDVVPEFNISAYPNPFTDGFTLESPEGFSGSIQLIDAKGKILVNNAIAGGVAQIPTNQVPPGTYALIVFQEEQEIKVFKLIKSQ